jgi:hypothetical protein
MLTEPLRQNRGHHLLPAKHLLEDQQSAPMCARTDRPPLSQSGHGCATISPAGNRQPNSDQR